MTLLPFPDMPGFICYHNKAFPFGVIQANSPKDITKWMCTKCINIVYNPKSPLNKFDIAISDIWGSWEGITTQQVFTIKKELISLIDLDLLNMFRVFIDHGCYIQGTYNERHIPSKSAYEKEDCNHDFLVIGYDEGNFYSVGFVADGRFRQFTIPNQKFIDALYDTGSSRVGINFFNYNEGAIPNPNINRMLSDLDNYIATADCLNNSDTSVNTYGIVALMRIKDFFIEEVIERGKLYVDRRYSRVLCEHEWVFTQVVEKFLNTNEKRVYQDYANNNYERAKLVHNLGLKMAYTGEENIIWRIASNIEKIIEDEMRYIPDLITLLKSKQNSGII